MHNGFLYNLILLSDGKSVVCVIASRYLGRSIATLVNGPSYTVTSLSDDVFISVGLCYLHNFPL